MRMTKPRSALVSIILAVLAMAGTVPSAGAANARPALDLQAAAASPSSVLYGQACPDVMVIGARGTNEGPTTDWHNPSAYAKDPDHGVGATVYSMFGQLKTANPKLVFSLEPAVYPTIFGGKTVLAFLQNAGQSAQYLGDAQIGEESIALDIQTTDAVCGHAKRYILAGYSLGAWAVHDALHELGSLVAEIAGVALFGDPKFQPGQSFVRDFTSEDKYYGIAYINQPQYDSIPPALVNQTGSWCLPADPVCQYRSDDIRTWLGEVGYCVTGSGACAHFQYATDGETLNAAAFLSPLLPPPTAPDTPGSVTAVAEGQYKIQVTWSEASTDVTGFNIDNGCPVGSCDPGATLTQTTGPVDSATFSVTPGTYQCFRVQAINNAGTSPWSGYGCTGTPGLVVSGTQEWTNTKVTVPAGDNLGITAGGQITVSPTETVGPAGDPSCTPTQNYPGGAFPAPSLPCYSLIARIGNGTPFEVGTSALVTATSSGVLFVGINDDTFSGNSGSWTVNIKLGGLPPLA
jgi:Cutinase